MRSACIFSRTSSPEASLHQERLALCLAQPQQSTLQNHVAGCPESHKTTAEADRKFKSHLHKIKIQVLVFQPLIWHGALTSRAPLNQGKLPLNGRRRPPAEPAFFMVIRNAGIFWAPRYFPEVRTKSGRWPHVSQSSMAALPHPGACVHGLIRNCVYSFT